MLNIFIDESGNFVPAEKSGSWSLSAAVVVPNPGMRKCREALRRLKVRSGSRNDEEIKLKHVSEKDYLRFLLDLRETGCTIYSIATDAGAQTSSEIESHRNSQARKIEENKSKMLHTEGVEMVEALANQVRALSPQLHLQLICQVELISDVLRKGILYYVQRTPAQLNGFRWRVDEKLSGESNFEKTFRIVIPPILQSKSIENPHPHVADFDYSAMKDYVYSKEAMPTYLEETYGIAPAGDGALNLGKIVWDDFKFVDSKKDDGVQIADLIASGLRRCLRGMYDDISVLSKALGSLMVQGAGQEYPMRLITLAGRDLNARDYAYVASEHFKSCQKSMLL